MLRLRQDATKRSLFIPLQGGLGNQLFQLAAGLVVGAQQHRPVVYSDYWLRNPARAETPRSLAIGPLLAPGELITQRVVRNGRVTDRVLRRRVVERGSADRVLDRVSVRTCVLAGYFQYAAVAQAGWPAVQQRLRESGRAELAALADPLTGTHGVLHVRLGDYVGTASPHGSLSPEYFGRALSSLSETVDVERWMLVSDEPSRALEMIKGFLAGGGPEVEVAAAADPWRDLGVIATARACAVSNSSFSWWGAFIASQSHSAPVVAPTPWFARGQQPDLLLPQWQLLPRIP